MSELVEKLSTGSHKVSTERYESSEELKEAVDRGFVLVKFTETKGGTEIGFTLDNEKSKTDFEDGSGKLHLVGKFVLDYVPVQCSADIDIKTLKGKGFLSLVDNSKEDDKQEGSEINEGKSAKANTTNKAKASKKKNNTKASKKKNSTH